MMFLKAMVLALISTGCIITPFAARADDVSVAAAASLTYAIRDITERFRRISGHRIQLTFGSSRNLMRQIIQGAPFEVFLSADQASVDRLVARSLTKGNGVIYAMGRLVVFKPTRSRVHLTADLGFLPQVIDNGDLKRLAIANPDTAPYGAIARDALRNAGLWETVKPYIVMGENALQAAQYGVSGSADAAIFPLSIALLPVFTRKGRYVLVADTLYRPLKQKMALLERGGEAAKAFYHYLQTTEAQSVLMSHGFLMQGQPNPGSLSE